MRSVISNVNQYSDLARRLNGGKHTLGGEPIEGCWVDMDEDDWMVVQIELSERQRQLLEEAGLVFAEDFALDLDDPDEGWTEAWVCKSSQDDISSVVLSLM
jgi:hypothetical protein